MLLNPLTQSIRRILFVRSDWLTKAEQLGLFDMPVLVKPHVKNGKVVRAYNRIQKKRLHPAPQAELFGDAPPKTESAKLGRLGHFIEKHGGYKRLYATLMGFTDAQRDTLLASMAKLAGKTPEAVLDILKTGAKHEVEPPQGDLFATGGKGNDDESALEAKKPMAEASRVVKPGVGEKSPSQMSREEFADHVSQKSGGRWSAGVYSSDGNREYLMPDARDNAKFDIGGVQYEWRITGGWHKHGTEMSTTSKRLEVLANGVSLGQFTLDAYDQARAAKSALAAMRKHQKSLLGEVEAEGDKPAENAADDDLRVGKISVYEYLQGQGIDPDTYDRDSRAIRLQAKAAVPYFQLMAELKGAASRLKSAKNVMFELDAIENNYENPFATNLVAARQLPPVLKQKFANKFAALPNHASASFSDSVRRDVLNATHQAEAEAAIRFARDAGKSTPVEPSNTGDSPKEGDTKTENGIEYRLQDGRWHRVTPEEAGQHQYGMTYRPPGPGAVPKGEYSVSDHPAFQHGVISYNRPLTDEEIKQFELTPISSLDDHAKRLIDKMGRYAGRYAENDAALEDFVNANQRRVGVWSTDDHQALLDRVKAKLKPGEPEKPEFQPTHELPDGTQVVAHADDPGVWVDARGDEYESDEAYPVRADDPVRNAAQTALNEAKEQGVITPQEHQAATDALETDGPGAAKAAIERERMPFSPENHIKIAADDVTRLRADDVYRLFEELPKDAEAFDDLRVYLINERPDLAATVMDAIDEVGMPDRVRKDGLSDADEAAKLVDSYAQADRIRDYLANGGAVQLANPRRILTLNSPDHIKKTASGVSIVEGRDSKSPDGYRWVSLFPDQVAQLAAQVPERQQPKEPWEMTREDVLKFAYKDGASYIENNRRQHAALDAHPEAVRIAVAEGKPVPPEVLADYPDLASQVPDESVKMKTYDWDAGKLANAYTLEELESLQSQTKKQHALPVDANGHPLENGKPTYHLYDKQGRKKLDALAWAIQSKINDQKRVEASKPESIKQEWHDTAKKLIADIADLTKKLDKTHSTVSSRAQATSREAQSGKLASQRDSLQSSLRKIIREARLRGEDIPDWVPEHDIEMSDYDEKGNYSPVNLDDTPKEGDRNAEGLVFHNGRWHREDDAEVRTAAIDDQIDAEEARRLNPEPLERLRAQIESMGGKAKLAEDMRRAFKDSKTRASAEAIVNELARASGLDRDTVLAEMGIKEVTRKPTAERTKPDTLSVGGDYSDDDPNSPNYRFRDTGYISGSRKEEAANMIRQAGRSGQRLRATDIDWQVIEQNPRQAKELITKSNLFGSVDWESLKAGGMEPATGFLIDRIYASIASEPGVDEPQARKDYAIGLESLRDRLESCKTPEHVTDVLEELKNEFDGIILNEAEKAAYDKAQAIYREFNTRRWELKKEREDLTEAANNISYQINNLEWQQTKRERRKWKRDPDIDRQIAELRPQQAAALQVIDEWEKAHPEALDTLETRKFVNAEGNQVVETRWHSPLRDMENKAYDTMRDIQAFSLARNREENPLHRAWQLMGQRFINVMKWRGYKGSDSFKNHVTAAKTGKVKDWSWAEKTTSAAPKAGKQKVRFQLRVAENFKRVGGRPVSVDSTAGLKERFNLRDVQSGNWVLSDPESAAFHVQRSSEALSDLADLLGVPDDAVSMNGRVALAFGARGKGNAGFGGAARAHYEPVERVINITKMGGGGALAHELFHAIDNLIREAETGQPGAKDDYVTENPGLLPEGDLKDAVRNLRSAMLEGNQPLWQIIKYTDRDTRLAKHNLERSNPLPVASMIKAAPNLEDALRQLDTYYLARGGWEAPHQKRAAKSRDEWRRIAAAWHDGLNAAGGRVQARVGAPVSDFAYQAHLLDEGQYGKYWSSTHELASRAFQSWCEDRLSDQGRKNDYLSCFADNQYYKDPLFGDSKPFPEGEERARINAAFDGLIAALRQRGTLQKAFMLMAA